MSKLDQVAFYCASNEVAEQVKRQFGLLDKEWIKDTVTSRAIVNGVEEKEQVAELQFCYHLQIEFEILRYVKGLNWHQENPLMRPMMEHRNWTVPAMISHVGVHLDDDEDFPAMEGCKLVQENFTISHTSSYLTTPGSPGFGRKYHYRIFDMSPGTYIKYIKRVHPK